MVDTRGHRGPIRDLVLHASSVLPGANANVSTITVSMGSEDHEDWSVSREGSDGELH